MVELNINGRAMTVDADPSTPLLWALRDNIGLTGTKFGRGVAVHESFGSVCAHVVEVSVEDRRIRVHRVTSAIDCGAAVNPLTIEAQVQSAMVFGLSAALYGKITLVDGRVEQGNFTDYPVLRLEETPQTSVHIVPSTGSPPIVPAVANAVAAATGKRLRNLPLDLAA